MTIPDYPPQLRHGKGDSPKDGGCLVQVAGFLYDGESWRDDVPCVHPLLRSVGIAINDSLTDDGLRRLSLLAARISGTGSFVADWTTERSVQLYVDLANWCATDAAESAARSAARSAAKYAAEYAAEYTAKYAARYAAEHDQTLIDFYTRLVDEFDRLTGRDSHDLTPEQGALICGLIGA